MKQKLVKRTLFLSLILAGTGFLYSLNIPEARAHGWVEWSPDPVTCGAEIHFRVFNHTSDNVWIEQTKNGAYHYNGSFPGTFDYNTICNQDEGFYVTNVYHLVGGAKGSSIGTDNITIKAKPPQPTVSIWPDSISISYNSSTVIHWRTTNATSCKVSPNGWTGTSGDRSTGNLISTTTYTANCSGPGGNAFKSATVNVSSAPTPTATISADSTNIGFEDSTIIRWSSTNASYCTAFGDWSGTKATSGSAGTGNLTSSKTYSINCSGAGGTSLTASVPVNVSGDTGGGGGETSVGSNETFQWAGDTSYRDSAGSIQTIRPDDSHPEGYGLTAIGYGSDDKNCWLYIWTVSVNQGTGTINNDVKQEQATRCSGGGGTSQLTLNPVTSHVATGWSWGAKTSGGKPGNDSVPWDECYYQEYAPLTNINSSSGWGATFDGTCNDRGYQQSWLKAIAYAPRDRVIVAVGMSLENDATIRYLAMTTRFVAPIPKLVWSSGPHHPDKSFISARGSNRDGYQFQVTNAASNSPVELWYNPNNTGWVNLGSQGNTNGQGQLTFPNPAGVIVDGAEGSYCYRVVVLGKTSNEDTCANIRDFDISASNITVQQGQSGNIPISVTNQAGGFNGVVAFSVTNCPSGWTCTGPVNISGSSNISITVPSTAPDQDYTLNIQGAYEGHIRTTSLTVKVTAIPTPTLSWASGPHHAGNAFLSQRSGSGNSDLWQMRVTGALRDSAVELQWDPPGGGENWQSLRNQGTTDVGGTLTFPSPAAAIADGAEGYHRYRVVVATKISNVIDANIQDYDISGSNISVTQGQSGSMSVSVTGQVGGFNGSVSFSITNCPSGWTCGTTSTAGSSNISITVPQNATAQNYNLTVRGSYDGHYREVGVTVAVNPVPGSFTLNSLTTSCSGSTPQVHLSWTPSPNATSYTVYRQGLPHANVGSATSFTDSSVSSGTNYSYFVRASNAFSTRDSAPQGTTATWCVGDITVRATLDGASWSGGISYRLLGPSTVNGNSVPGLHSNLQNGTWNLSLVSGGPSGSSLSSITPSSSQTLPANVSSKPSITFTFNFTTNKPGSFTLNSPSTSCSGSSPQINLSWGSSSNATSYTVFRNGSSYANVGLNTSYTDGNVSSGTSYSYFIRASNAGGSTDSNSRSVTATWCVGDITVNATLDGASWSGSVNYRLLGSSTINGSSVATTHSNVQNGTWTLSYTSGGPANSTLASITPAGSQTLPGNVASKPAITFTFNFTTNKPGSFTLNSPTTSCSGATPQINLSWGSSSNATSYTVFRNGSSYANVGLNTSYTDGNVSSGTSYSYFIRATNPGGTTDSNSRSVTATWCVGDINVNATFNGSAWSGSLNYRLLGPGPTVQGSSVATTHSDRQNGTWTLNYQSGGPASANLTSISSSSSQTIPGNVASKPSITYTFNFTSTPPGSFTLNAPTTSCSGSTPRIELSWSSSSNATSYTVFRNGSSYANVGPATSYTDTSVSSGTNYSYFIRATNPGGFTDSNTRSQAAYWCVGDIVVNATFNGSAWSGSLNYRLLGPGPTVQGSSVATTHSDRQNGTWTLDYQSGGPGASSLTSITPASSQTIPSNTSLRPALTFTFNFTSTPPNTPSQLAANNTSQCERITLTWKDNSSNEQGFHVWREPATGGGAPLNYNGRTYRQIATLGVNATSYQDTTLSPGQSYYYIVTSYNVGGESGVSGQNAVGPVFNYECAPNLGLSSNVIDQVNGSPYTGQSIKNGDTVKFKIIINNSGNSPAFNLYVDDSISNNLVYQAGTARLQKGSGPNNSISANQVSATRIIFDSSQNLGDKAADGSNWLLTFDVTVNSSSSQSVDFLENSGRIYYAASTGGAQTLSVSVGTGLVPLRTGKARVPEIREITP